MDKHYYKSLDIGIIETNKKHGLKDSDGNLLLPIEYDMIHEIRASPTMSGFLLVRDSKFGYIEFYAPEHSEEASCSPNACAQAFLPCVYSRMDSERNGLLVYQNTDHCINPAWYDFKSRTLHNDLLWMQNYEDFDSFLILGTGSCMPTLKKAGEDKWVKLPKNSNADPRREIPLDSVGVRCILCQEEIATDDEWDDGTIAGYQYFLLLLLQNGWMATPAKRSLSELYAEIPAITQELTRCKNREKSKEKQAYSVLCNYQKQNDECN